MNETIKFVSDQSQMLPAAAVSARSGRFDLAALPLVRRLVASRWPLFLARALTLAGFTFTILAGLFGSRVGNHNFAIIFVWIAWWTALKLVFIPLGGRSWCSVCPLPMPGEWLQQGGFVQTVQRRLGLQLRWPRRLGGLWLQAGFFLLIGLFSALTLTDPRVTAVVLLGLIVLAAVLSLVFERRAFCSYICPIGGFTGIYAKAAPLEVRVKSASLCAAHRDKSCYTACPWGQYPLALKDSAACGLCMECLRVCPYDNIALNIRPFGQDLKAVQPARRLDEAFLALVMLGSALSFAAVFTGPWGWLKNAAYNVGSLEWLGYSGGYLLLNLLLLPGLFFGTVWASGRLSGSRLPLRKQVAAAAHSLLPLGLFAWIAFTVSFALPKFNYVLTVVSDPLGWGWDLFGTAASTWTFSAPGFSALLQVVLLLVGLAWSLRVLGGNLQDQSKKLAGFLSMLPLAGFNLLVSIGMLWLLIG